MTVKGKRPLANEITVINKSLTRSISSLNLFQNFLQLKREGELMTNKRGELPEIFY